MLQINKARGVLVKAVMVVVLECGGREETNTQQNRKCFELYIPAISDKLREGFVINHENAVLPTKRIAWWAAARDLGVCCCLVRSSSLQPHLYQLLPHEVYVIFNIHQLAT